MAHQRRVAHLNIGARLRDLLGEDALRIGGAREHRADQKCDQQQQADHNGGQNLRDMFCHRHGIDHEYGSILAMTRAQSGKHENSVREALPLGKFAKVVLMLFAANFVEAERADHHNPNR